MGVLQQAIAGFGVSTAPSGLTPPTFVAAGAISYSAGATTTTPAIPSHLTNDIIVVAIVVMNDNQTVTASGGWGTIATENDTTGHMYSKWFWIRSSDGATANPTITCGGTSEQFSATYVYRGCVASGTPYEAQAVNKFASNPATEAITTLGGNRLAVSSCLKFQAADYTGGLPPAGWTTDANQSDANGSGARHTNISKTIAVAGSVPSVTIGTRAGFVFGVLTMGLIPA